VVCCAIYQKCVALTFANVIYIYALNQSKTLISTNYKEHGMVEGIGYSISRIQALNVKHDSNF